MHPEKGASPWQQIGSIMVMVQWPWRSALKCIAMTPLYKASVLTKPLNHDHDTIQMHYLPKLIFLYIQILTKSWIAWIWCINECSCTHPCKMYTQTIHSYKHAINSQRLKCWYTCLYLFCAILVFSCAAFSIHMQNQDLKNTFPWFPYKFIQNFAHVLIMSFCLEHNVRAILIEGSWLYKGQQKATYPLSKHLMIFLNTEASADQWQVFITLWL